MVVYECPRRPASQVCGRVPPFWCCCVDFNSTSVHGSEFDPRNKQLDVIMPGGGGATPKGDNEAEQRLHQLGFGAEDVKAALSRTFRFVYLLLASPVAGCNAESVCTW